MERLAANLLEELTCETVFTIPVLEELQLRNPQ